MSARDRDTEQSVAADEPTSTVPASPPRRDPVEDADASFARKRPRLDDESTRLRAMSSDAASPRRTAAKPHDAQVEMTIRSHPPSSPVPAGDEDLRPANEFPEEPRPAQQPPSIVVPDSDDEPGSPPVMVIDDDESAAFAVQVLAEDHFRQFPYAHAGNYTQALRDMTHHVQTAVAVDIHLFPVLARWLLDLPDPSVDLQGFYVNKAMFWEEFGALLNKVLHRRYQWISALAAHHHDDQGRFPFGDHCEDLQADDIFFDFLSAYARLCSLLFLADVHLLSRPRSDEIYALPLLSFKHIRHLSNILRSEKTNLFHPLHKAYSTDTRDLSNRLHKAFLTANGAENLFRLAHDAYHQVPIKLQSHIAIWASQLFTVLGASVFDLPDMLSDQDRANYHRRTLLFFDEYSNDLFNLSRTTDANVARDLIQYFSTLLTDICQWDENTAAQLVDRFLDFADPESPTTSSPMDIGTINQDDYRQDPMTFPALVANAWKFKLLRKYVVRGKMDLRVMSIATMDSALIEIWKEYSSLDAMCRHPVMQYLADFLLHGQVVDYIISVDSHPQLISRSGNIVGFLVVTHRWSDSQADAIWNTISTNTDPRVVAATMTMLRSIVPLMGPSEHLYICQKLYELPIDRYTLEILRLLRDLTGKMMENSTPVDYGMRGSDATPWNVCIRMIRDTAPSQKTDKTTLELYTEAIDQLRAVAHIVPQEDRHAIYRECAQHIADRSTEATGSLKAIYTFAAQSHPGDGVFFQHNPDLTHHILQEIPFCVQAERQIGQYHYQTLVLRCRLEVLALIVCRAGPAMLNDSFGELWDYTVGKYALSNDARNIAWAQLLHTIKVSPDNKFCQQLVSTYMPKMNPDHYTSGLFEFVANYGFSPTRQLVVTDRGEEMVLQIPGADLLWTMVLSSPQGRVEDQATRLLASRYVQITDTEGVNLPEVEAAHVVLVEKCMQELRSTAKVLRKCNPTVTEEGLRENEIRFGRIVLFQKLLLEYIRQKPEFNRGRRSDSKIDELDITYGNAITIRYQCLNERQSVTMSSDHTLKDLYMRLCHATGYAKVNLFAKGQRLSVPENAAQKLSDMNFGGQLLVQRAEGAEVTRVVSSPVAGCSAFEITVVKYFDELFELMDSDDTASQLLFGFLSDFPYRSLFADSVMSGQATTEGLFPPNKFFQARYAAQALQSRLREQIRSSNLDEKFLARSIHHLAEALLNPKLISDPISNFQELRLAAVLVNVLLEFLRERPSPDISAAYFSNGALLSNRLVKILSVALETNEDAAVVQDSYAVLLEASLHSRAVWDAFISDPQAGRLYQNLLLSDPRQSVREHVAMKMTSVCGGDLPSTCPLTKGEIANRFWFILSPIIPKAVRHPKHSQQLFEIAGHVFRANDEYDHNEASLRSSLARWTDVIMSYQHEEFVGREETDHVVLGITKLLLCCVISIKSFKKPVNAGTLMEQIFRKYIFVKTTSIAEDRAGESITLPILDSDTRLALYELMLALVDDRSTYDTLLQLAGEVESDEFEPVLPSVSVDRSLELRSTTGYVGLHNPRAICYMNSLMTQLYMNLDFREFILSVEVQEANGSQRLLAEMQRLFTQMQHSFRKCTDPRAFAACVKNLEQAPIDISIQMDVDEFFTLFLDQSEGQLIKDEDKQKFRSFYGGQTLNQIKSKECEHVSERTEPFFAIQCDVQGKANLQESLQAFVRGDVMEGDNKYKCESCDGKFVDAIKRTCLKVVPDNLIFHLKRFEFDLIDFSRRKIYDQFEFPLSMDVSLLTFEHLNDPSKPLKEDIFDLVGILVHTGTCENGHYYSYIRERPTQGDCTTWVEFDDANVGLFDPSEIGQRTYGGVVDEMYGRQPKQYSAYMLFYQRRAAMEEDQSQWIASAKGQDLKVAVPQVLKDEVDVKNELFIREYCLFDPNHSKFVKRLHAMSRTINNGTCSEDHEQEIRALQIVLAHLSQILWRQQKSELFIDTLAQLRRSVLSCSTCCGVVLRWFTADDYALLNLIVRCTHPKVRSQTRIFFIECLRIVREKEPTLYGIDGAESDMDVDLSTEGLLVNLAGRLRMVADETYVCTRGWDDFYLVLTQVIEMGHVETAVLLNNGTLEFLLKLFSFHVQRQSREDAFELSRIMSKRTGIFNKLIECLSILLCKMDLRLPPLSSRLTGDRQGTLDRERMRFPMTVREKFYLLCWDNDLKAIAVLDKILEHFDQTRADFFYPGNIVKWMVEADDFSVQTNLVKSISEGVTLEPPFCDAYIRAGLAFCEACPIIDHVSKVIAAISKATSSSSRQEDERAPGGEAFLDFFAGLLKANNEALFKQKHHHIFHHWLMAKSRLYASPLLTHTLEGVRKGAYAFFHDLFGDSVDYSPDMLYVKWKSIRELAEDLIRRIIYEKDAGMLRSHLNPLISTCQYLVHLLYALSQNEEPGMASYRSVNDTALIHQYQLEIETRLSMWPHDEDTPLSTGDFDQSDYGSESDDGQELLDG